MAGPWEQFQTQPPAKRKSSGDPTIEFSPADTLEIQRQEARLQSTNLASIEGELKRLKPNDPRRAILEGERESISGPKPWERFVQASAGPWERFGAKPKEEPRSLLESRDIGEFGETAWRLWTEESIPAHLISAYKKGVFDKPLGELVRNAKDEVKDFSFGETWDAAVADPKKFAGHVLDAVVADPYMLLAPWGLGGKIALSVGKSGAVMGKAGRVAGRAIGGAAEAAAAGGLLGGAQAAAAQLDAQGFVNPSQISEDMNMPAAMALPFGAAIQLGASMKKGVTPKEIWEEVKVQRDAVPDGDHAAALKRALDEFGVEEEKSAPLVAEVKKREGLTPEQTVALSAGGLSAIALAMDEDGLTAPEAIGAMFLPVAIAHPKTKRAEFLASKGASREDIWRDTGLFQGADKVWRREVSDADAQLVPGLTRNMFDDRLVDPIKFGQPKKLGELIHHPQLFRLYPELKNAEVRAQMGGGGSYNESTNVFTVGGGRDADVRSTLLHEIQHYVQNKGDMMRGGSSAQFTPESVDARLEELDRAWGELKGSIEGLQTVGLPLVADLSRRLLAGDDLSPRANEIVDKVPAEALKLAEQYLELRKVKDEAYESYRRLGGEVEARVVQKRANMSQEQRANIPPWRHYDVPEDKFLMSFKAGSLAAAGGLALATLLDTATPEELAGMSTAAILVAGRPKKPGGMWHPEAVKRLSEPLANKLEAPQGWAGMDDAGKPKEGGAAWADKAISRYLNKHAGTETDPLKDIKIPMAGDEARWEDITDKVITHRPAGEHKKAAAIAGDDLRDAEWLKRMPNEEALFNFKSPAEQGAGFNTEAMHSGHALLNYLSHVGDYLREFVPAEKLSQYDLVRAVKETAAQDAKQAAKMAKARAENAGTTVFKEYPDGMKWVEVGKTGEGIPKGWKVYDDPNGVHGKFVSESPDGEKVAHRTREEAVDDARKEVAAIALKNEGDVMGHCVGGYCEAVHAGESKIYSLRDAKGMSHVTIEVAPDRASAKGPEAASEDIIQIKGKQNRAPNENYLPYVQDFVKSGKWGEVGDLENSGLTHIKREMNGPWGHLEPGFYTKEEFDAATGITKANEEMGLAGLGPRGQQGFANTRLLAAVAAAGGGAALLAALDPDPESKFKRMMQGAAIGGGLALLPGAKIIKGLDYSLGAMSTRVKNISPLLHQRWIGFERGLLSRISGMKTAADPFLVRLNKVRGDLKGELNRAILTNDPQAINAAIAATGDAELAQGWQLVRHMLDVTGQTLMAGKRIVTALPDYFPRIVADREGLLKKLGAQFRGPLEIALQRAKSRGAGLSQVEESRIINDFLLAPMRMGGVPGWAKGRTIGQITKDLEPFYLSPTDSLHAYIRTTAMDIERARFFGKDAQFVQQGNQQHLNVDASIGELVNQQINSGAITHPQAVELNSMLKSRFGPGEKPRRGGVQDLSNVTNALLLGNPLSAIVQLGDIAASVAVQGMLPTLQSLVLALTGNAKIRPKDIGLINHIGEEFVTSRGTAKFLQGMLKWSGFSGVDYLGKTVNLNAAKLRMEKLARSPEGRAELGKKYGASYGADLPQLISDLQGRQLTPLTRNLYFSELSRVQPVSKFELPQGYLDNPDIGKVLGGIPIDGRSFYQLKSFMLKQADLIRREAYNEIKAGKVGTGLAKFVKFGLALGISGAAPTLLNQFIMGKPLDDAGWEDIPLNALKTFGWSNYVLDKGLAGHPIEAVAGLAIPPYQMFEELLRADPKAIKYLPLVGKVLFQQEWTDEAKEEGDKKRLKTKMRDIDRELKPFIGQPDEDTKDEIKRRKAEERLDGRN